MPTAVLATIHAFGTTSGQESQRGVERASSEAVGQWLRSEKTLKVVDQRSPKITRDALCRVLDQRPALTSVDVSRCFRGLAEGEWGPVAAVLRGKPLVALTVNRTHSHDGDLAALVTECRHLQRLYARTCPNLTVLDGFAAEHLTHLDLFGCIGLEDDGLLRVGEHCPALANLNIGTHHTDMTVLTPGGVCGLLELRGAQLRTLSLSGNEALGNRVRCCIARCCVGLVALDSRGCRMDNTVELVKACTKLRFLCPATSLAAGQLTAARSSPTTHKSKNKETFDDFFYTR